MTLQSEDFIYPVCIDLKDTFNKLNKFPLNDKFRTFLLDNTNKVILVGNPMHHPRIISRRWRVMNEPEGKRKE